MAIVIIDYGAGNLKSITNMLDFLGVAYKISDKKMDILTAEKLIFPGQGHFAQAMDKLIEKDLVETIKEAINKKIPFLGICLGLQILFEESEEALNVKGLGVLKGKVKKFTIGKIPQIGWNKVIPVYKNDFLSEDYFYYVNSYYVVPEDENIILAKTFYEQEFCCAVKKDNIIAVQFHPEKSSDAGIDFFKNFLKV